MYEYDRELLTSNYSGHVSLKKSGDACVNISCSFEMNSNVPLSQTPCGDPLCLGTNSVQNFYSHALAN